MQRLWVHPTESEAFAQAGIGEFSQVMAHLGIRVPSPNVPGAFVTPAELRLPTGVREVYFKIYIEPVGSLRFLGRASKARREVFSYEAFQKLGIRCPKWVACGEHRDRLQRLQSAFILTEAVPQSVDLTEFLSARCPDAAGASSRQQRDAIIEQLADAVRTAHDASFFHNDLHWRNILVDGDALPRVWWIDCPRGRFLPLSPMKHRYRIKDLACIDRSAVQYCTLSERQSLIARYLRDNGSQARRLLRDVEAYRRRKWPSDEVARQ